MALWRSARESSTHPSSFRNSSSAPIYKASYMDMYKEKEAFKKPMRFTGKREREE